MNQIDSNKIYGTAQEGTNRFNDSFSSIDVESTDTFELNWFAI